MPICIPMLTGVPYLHGLPAFFTTGAAPPASFDTQVEDPRWTGSYAFGYGSGAGPIALLRLGWGRVAGVESILLSWHCRADPISDQDDQLWLGLKTTQGELFVRIQWKSTGPAVCSPHAIANTVIWSATVYERQPNGTVDTGTPLGATPAWVTENTRVWRAVGGVPPHLNCPWAVHVRIPIKATATSRLDPDGVPIDLSNFRMWVYGEQHFDSDGSLVPFQWPPIPTVNGPEAPYGPESDPVTAGEFMPPPSQPSGTYPGWHEVSGAATCSGAGGVSIAQGRFGTRNAPVPGDPTPSLYTFRRNEVNTFFAKPTNQSSAVVPAHTVAATFRLANWGSTAGVGGTWAALPLWKANPGDPDPDPTNRGTLATGSVLPSAADDVEVPVDLRPWEPEFIAGTRTTHQCMGIDLDVRAGTVALSVGSAVQNMDFVVNSIQRREAEINVQGLKENIDSVFIFFEMNGMTEGPYQWGAAAERAIAANPHDEEVMAVFRKLQPILGRPGGDDRRDFDSLVAEVLRDVDPAVFEKLIPSVKVHVYYPTGQRIRQGGRWRRVYAPATSFGLYGLAQRTEGWRATFGEAIRVQDNLYQIPIPQGFGRARIPTLLQGLHPDEPPLRAPPIRRRVPHAIREDDLLGRLIDRLDLLVRLQRRILDRFGLLDEVARRSELLSKRLGEVPWGREAKQLLDEIAGHCTAAREAAKGSSRHLQALAGFEQQLALLDGLLDVIAAFPAEELERIVLKAFGGREGCFSEVLRLVQRAYLVAYKSYSAFDAGLEVLREADGLLGRVDEGAGVLRRIGLDLDRRSPFDLDIELPLIKRDVKLRDLIPRVVPFGGALTLARSMQGLGALTDSIQALRKRFEEIDAIHGELAEVAEDLGSVDESTVRRVTARLQRLHG